MKYTCYTILLLLISSASFGQIDINEALWQNAYTSDNETYKAYFNKYRTSDSTKRSERSLIVKYAPKTIVDTANIIDGDKKQTFVRVLKVSVHKLYTEGKVEEMVYIDTNSLRYYYKEYTNSHSITVQYPWGDKFLFSDDSVGMNNEVYKPYKYISLYYQDTLKSNLFDTYSFTEDANITKRDVRNRLLGYHSKYNLYLGVTYTPSVSLHGVAVNSATFTDLNAIFHRDSNEHASYGHSASFQIGYNFRRHTVYAELLRMRYGFVSKQSIVDWSQGGLAVADIRDISYIFRNSGIGIGYQYSGYEHLINGAIEMGVYYQFFDVTYQEKEAYKKDELSTIYPSNMRKLQLNTNAFGFKLGMGLSIRPNYRVEFKLMPTLFYNTTPANTGSINTYFYNIGVTTGFAYRGI